MEKSSTNEICALFCFCFHPFVFRSFVVTGLRGLASSHLIFVGYRRGLRQPSLQNYFHSSGIRLNVPNIRSFFRVFLSLFFLKMFRLPPVAQAPTESFNDWFGCASAHWKFQKVILLRKRPLKVSMRYWLRKRPLKVPLIPSAAKAFIKCSFC